MGLGPSAVTLNLELWQRGFFKDINSVIDMGSQHLTIPKGEFEELVQIAGVPDYKKEDFANLANWPGYPRCSSRPFYEMLGVKKYSCIDLNKEFGAIPHDLNFPLQDSSLYGQYDLVTDHGTNEHVFNTVEAYRTMHRLCREHGIMVIIQLLYHGNGYYTYEPSFFEGIAAANNYKIFFSSYVINTNEWTGSENKEAEFHIPLSDKALATIDLTKVATIGICYVMQKGSNADFKCPYQGEYLSNVQGHYGYRLQFLPTPPSRAYLPVYSLETTQARFLLQALSRKAIRRIKAGLRLK